MKTKEDISLLKEEEELLIETKEIEEATQRIKHEVESGDFFCKVMEVEKTVTEITPEGTEYFIGTYDYSNCFHTVFDNFHGFYGDYVNIPKSKLELTPDCNLKAEVIEDSYNFLVSKGDSKYKEWKEGKRQLWRCTYMFRIKLGKEYGEETYENLKEKLQL
jgi:hypothetical protein